MVKRIDRTGEIKVNNFGSKIIIQTYRNKRHVDIYFPEYNWTFYHSNYSNFTSGNIKCPYERRICNIGYFGEGYYTEKEYQRIYSVWRDLIRRTYDAYSINRDKNLAYKDVTVCTEWHNFQNFAKWYEENYYEINDENMMLDKDILCKGNKIYNPTNCIFVPARINNLFTKSNNARGEFPIGVCYRKDNQKFQSYCNIMQENTKVKKHLGFYNTPTEAFIVYKNFKESYIKQVADEYKELIPIKLYNAMYSYEVEITD